MKRITSELTSSAYWHSSNLRRRARSGMMYCRPDVKASGQDLTESSRRAPRQRDEMVRVLDGTARHLADRARLASRCPTLITKDRVGYRGQDAVREFETVVCVSATAGTWRRDRPVGRRQRVPSPRHSASMTAGRGNSASQRVQLHRASQPRAKGLPRTGERRPGGLRAEPFASRPEASGHEMPTGGDGPSP